DHVTAVTFHGVTYSVPETGTATIEGDHGELIIDADGSYTYTLFPGEAGGTTTVMNPVIMTDPSLGVTVEVDGVQTAAGVEFTIKLIGGTADLNGFFLDLGGNGGPILSLGPGNNMNSTN